MEAELALQNPCNTRDVLHRPELRLKEVDNFEELRNVSESIYKIAVSPSVSKGELGARWTANNEVDLSRKSGQRQGSDVLYLDGLSQIHVVCVCRLIPPLIRSDGFNPGKSKPETPSSDTRIEVNRRTRGALNSGRLSLQLHSTTRDRSLLGRDYTAVILDIFQLRRYP